MSVEVNQLTKVYGQQKAIDSISFTASPGEILGFLGPNGAGKSTTMKILSCFIPQTSGTASVAGYDVSSQSLDVRRNLGYLPEHNPLYLDMYVKEFLEFVANVHEVSNKRRRIDEVIELTGLGRESHKKAGALSKGYRQRLGLAQVILPDPAVLIMDEPTSGLDPNQLVEVRALIRELGKTKTVILSTHIMPEAETVCSRAVIINRGQIVADNTMTELHAAHPGKTLEDIFLQLTNKNS